MNTLQIIQNNPRRSRHLPHKGTRLLSGLA